MAIDFESDTSSTSEVGPAKSSGWLKFGLVAIASAVLGGMGAAWWYRKTLIRLRQAEEATSNPQFGISDDDLDDEV